MGHWLQKATEHVLGCVLCSPGCFSLFRAKAIMDDNVMAKYVKVANIISTATGSKEMLFEKLRLQFVSNRNYYDDGQVHNRGQAGEGAPAV